MNLGSYIEIQLRMHKHILISLLLIFTIMLTGCGAGLSPAEHLQRAKAYRTGGNLNAGIIELKNVLQSEPGHAEARWLLGELYLEQGNGAAALKELERAKELGRNTPELKIALLQSLLLQQQYLEVILKTPSVDDKSATTELLTLRGEAHMGLNKLDRAKQVFERAIELDPVYMAARLAMVRLALRGGKFDDAQQQLDHIEQQDKTNIKLWLLRGALALQMQSAEQAEAAYRQALAISENEPVAQLGLARALIGQSNFAESRELIERFKQQFPNNPVANVLLASIELQQKNREKAKDALLQVTRVVPNNPQALMMLATIYYEDGQLQKAAQHLQRFQAAFPNYFPAQKRAAAIELRLGKPADAIKSLRLVIDQASNDPQFFALLGSAYLRNGEVDEGTAYLSHAAEMAPEQASIKTQLALGKLSSGDAEQAIVELESAVELDPELIQADILLGLIHLRRQEYVKALEVGKRSVEKHSDNPLFYNLMGAAYLGQKEYESAASQFNRALEVDPEFSPAMNNLANIDYLQKNTGAARKKFEAVLQINEKNIQALIGLARIAGDANDASGYTRHLEKARRANSHVLAPRLLLANYYLTTGDFESGLDIAREARDIAPERPAILTLLGKLEHGTGNYNAAIETFSKVVAAQPESAEDYFLLGLAQRQANQPVKARSSWQKSLELQPGNLLVLSGLASMDMQSGKYDDAMARVSEIKATHPKSPEGDAIEGDINMARGQIPDGLKAYERAFNIQQTSILAIKLYQARLQSDDQAGAQKSLIAWIKQHPQDIATKLVYAGSQLQAGNSATAIRLYEEILRQSPDNIVALNNLAWLYHENKDPRALELAQRAYKLKPDMLSVVDTLAWVLIEQGQVERGLTLLQPVVTGDGVEPSIRYHYAVGLAKSGETDNARAELNRLLSSNETFQERQDAAQLLKSLNKK